MKTPGKIFVAQYITHWGNGFSRELLYFSDGVEQLKDAIRTHARFQPQHQKIVNPLEVDNDPHDVWAMINEPIDGFVISEVFELVKKGTVPTK